MRERKRLHIPTMFACILFAIAPAVAGEGGDEDEEGPAPGRWSLGVVGVFSTSPYKSYDNTILPLPMISYEGERFFVKNLEAGMYLWKNDNHELSIGARYFGLSFKPGDTDDVRLKQLDKRYSTVMAKAAYAYSLPYGMQIEASVSQDVLGQHNGLVGETSFRAPLLMREQFMVFAEVGAKWSSKKVNDYYYGVSRKEAVRSGLPQYKAKGGVTPVAGIQAMYTINHKWSAMAGAQVEILNSKIKDSPMVDKSVITSVMAGVRYSF